MSNVYFEKVVMVIIATKVSISDVLESLCTVL